MVVVVAAPVARKRPDQYAPVAQAAAAQHGTTCSMPPRCSARPRRLRSEPAALVVLLSRAMLRTVTLAVRGTTRRLGTTFEQNLAAVAVPDRMRARQRQAEVLAQEPLMVLAMLVLDHLRRAGLEAQLVVQILAVLAAAVAAVAFLHLTWPP